MFKEHFITMLCGTDVSFPAKLLCYLLVQAEHQLNMLRKSRVDKNKSSFEVLCGQHNYNANPWAPLGAAIKAPVMLQNRKIWSKHTLTVWYLGNVRFHYICYEVWKREQTWLKVTYRWRNPKKKGEAPEHYSAINF